MLAERVIVAINELCQIESIVAHRRVIKYLVFVHQVLHVLWVNVANSDPELAVVAWESLVLITLLCSTGSSSTVVDFFAHDRNKLISVPFFVKR